MDNRIAGLDTEEKCEAFEKNALRLDRPDLAQECRVRVVEIKREDHDLSDYAREDTDIPEAAQEDGLRAACAYESTLINKNGRKKRATATWNMFKKHGIIGGVERAVQRDKAPEHLQNLASRGLEEHAFENVVLRHPELFSKDAVKLSEKRVAKLQAA